MTFPVAAFFLTAAYLASLISNSESNKPISVDFPTHNNVFRVRDKICIKWTAKSGDKVISRILLLENASDPLDLSYTIAKSVEISREEYAWTIPDSITSGYNYTIAFDIGGQLVFSKAFTIYNDSLLETV